MTTNNFFSPRRTQFALSLVGLVTALLILNIKTIHWPFGIVDSPILLAQAISFSPLEYFTSPSKYQFLTYNNLTPWVTLSWDVDYALFQLDALGYRIHHLVSLIAMAGIAYAVLYRTTGSILNASLFTFAIITAPATCAVLDDLVNRHYLEGMIFCLLSFLCAHTYNRKPALVWLVLSVFLYALSTTAKEVFIPLPGILFFLFAGSFKRKVSLILPYAVVLMGYLVWRLHMLSGSGGYTSASASLGLLENPGVLLDLALILLASLFNSLIVSGLFLAVFAVLLAVNFRKLQPATRLAVLTGVLGLLLPLVALLPMLAVGFLSPRWLFAPTIGLLLCFAYLGSITHSKLLRGGVYLLVFACSASAYNARFQAPEPLYVKGKGKVHTQILQSDPNTYLRLSRYSEMAAQGYATWVYIAKLHNNAWGTQPIFDGGQLRYHDVSGKTAVPIGRRARAFTAAEESGGAALDLLQGSSYDAESDQLNFDFADRPLGDTCFVYIFGEHNGLLFGRTACSQWSIQYRQLEYLLRMTGLDISTAAIAQWSDQADPPFHSKPYKLRDLVDRRTP